MTARMMGCRSVHSSIPPPQLPLLVHGHERRGLGHGQHRTAAGSNLKAEMITNVCVRSTGQELK